MPVLVTHCVLPAQCAWKRKGLDGGLGDDAASGFERVAFAQLIDRVFLLARSFNFSVPPYFISNVRALGERLRAQRDNGTYYSAVRGRAGIMVI